jgi:hypothetical protein
MSQLVQTMVRCWQCCARAIDSNTVATNATTTEVWHAVLQVQIEVSQA